MADHTSLLDVHLKQLRLPAFLRNYRQLAHDAAQANQDHIRFLSALAEQEVASVRETVLDRLHLEAVPATVITDAAGGVLHVQWGPPTVSKIRELLARGTIDRCPR